MISRATLTHKAFQASLACLAFAILAENAAAQLTAPSAGFVRQRDGTVRQLSGLAGNYVAGVPVHPEPALAFAFDSQGGIMQTASGIFALDDQGRELARFDPPPGPAVLNATLAYFASNQSLWTYAKDAQSLPLPLLPFDGTVLAIGGSASAVTLAVRRNDEIWRLRIAADGSVYSQEALQVGIGLRPVQTNLSAILLLPNGILYSTDADIFYIDDSTHLTKHWTLSERVESIASMSPASFQITTATSMYALRLDRDVMSLLPESSPEPI